MLCQVHGAGVFSLPLPGAGAVSSTSHSGLPGLTDLGCSHVWGHPLIEPGRDLRESWSKPLRRAGLAVGQPRASCRWLLKTSGDGDPTALWPHRVKTFLPLVLNLRLPLFPFSCSSLFWPEELGSGSITAPCSRLPAVAGAPEAISAQAGAAPGSPPAATVSGAVPSTCTAGLVSCTGSQSRAQDHTVVPWVSVGDDVLQPAPESGLLAASCSVLGLADTNRLAGSVASLGFTMSCWYLPLPWFGVCSLLLTVSGFGPAQLLPP